MSVRQFVKIDTQRHEHRWYAIAWGPTLFGNWAVVRSWGRIGTSWTQCKSEIFEDDDAACAEAEVQTKKRLKRGYRLVKPAQIDIG